MPIRLGLALIGVLAIAAPSPTVAAAQSPDQAARAAGQLATRVSSLRHSLADARTAAKPLPGTFDLAVVEGENASRALTAASEPARSDAAVKSADASLVLLGADLRTSLDAATHGSTDVIESTIVATQLKRGYVSLARALRRDDSQSQLAELKRRAKKLARSARQLSSTVTGLGPALNPLPVIVDNARTRIANISRELANAPEAVRSNPEVANAISTMRRLEALSPTGVTTLVGLTAEAIPVAKKVANAATRLARGIS